MCFAIIYRSHVVMLGFNDSNAEKLLILTQRLSG